jgi:hypothetical protein
MAIGVLGMMSLSQQWLTAAEDLGIRVIVPFALITELGERVEFDAAVHGFGSPKGMLLMSEWDAAKANLASSQGYGYSCMDAGAYDRESMMETLRDWGWSALGEKPPWL